MCGLVGIFQPVNDPTIDGGLLDRMNTSQAHRGPDGQGVHIEARVGLGHRRLSIIDVATGQQPLWNEDHSVVIVYNGEIYNFQELVAELTRARASVSHALATPRSSFTRGRNGARTASSVFVGCSRLPCGIEIGRRFFSLATGSASSRCSMPRPRAGR